MKKPYKGSILDSELAQFEADIVWKNGQSDEMKERLIRDLHKISVKARRNKGFAFPVRMCVAAAVLAIAFVLVKQENFNRSHSSRSSYPEGINTFEQPTQNKDVSVTFSREEQDLIEKGNSDQERFLTEEAVIPTTIIFPSIAGKPEIAATKDQGRVLASVIYPVKGGKSISIETAINQRGSAKRAYDSLVKRYSGFSSMLTIGGHQAILVNPFEADGVHRLIVVSDGYIYSISGGKSSDDVIKLAKSIQFSK
ncbi:hypothetical protein [Neobacillus sp. PS2-9]|uniref:hypothetical protein n=1 Tax=Neobacillus sp. PS2-9 TaxID=3070676 RepID=UPI0027DF5C66|nr:hypothetical protein [Neobacillus sp. PS2-9]WML58802.1 hypothetical protein RCG25_03115 [Neobacillus sp. PS2-9]